MDRPLPTNYSRSTVNARHFSATIVAGMMPSIYRVVTSYQPPFAGINTNGEATLQCRKLDLYRSIITVGNPSYFSLQAIRDYGFARVMYDSIFKKIAIVASNIQSDLGGMRRHPIFDGYVSDEKRIVSYNLGMAFAKLYSEKLLGIPNLVHTEFLKRQNAITFARQAANVRPKEPDLVGQTSDGNWHLFEAKGVSSSTSQLNRKIAEAKNQVRQVAAIHGVAPLTGSACATFIGRDRILTHLVDPPSDEGKKLKLIEKSLSILITHPFCSQGIHWIRPFGHSVLMALMSTSMIFIALAEG